MAETTWIPELIWRKGPAEPLAELIRESDRRKEGAQAVLRELNRAYGTRGQFRGIVDAFHGETAFGVEASAAAALERAWGELLSGRAKLSEADGSAYDKRSPKVLRELAARRLFNGLRAPTSDSPGVEVQPDEVVVCPYSSTLLMEEAFATLSQPGGVVLAPEGFYKGNALHAFKYGLRIRSIPVGEATGFKLTANALRLAVREARLGGGLCGLLLTMPGNPLIVSYTRGELEELGQVIVEESLPVICDAVFDKLQAGHIPLASVTVPGRDRDVRLYDHVLTITGNSKGHGASGPYKLGAACTGNAEWRARLASRMTTIFQRETTHLVRAILENTSDDYFARNRKIMADYQSRVHSMIREINARKKFAALRPIPAVSTAGIFVSLELDERLRMAAGITDSMALEEMLLFGQGINSASFARMGSPCPAVRLNVLAARKDGVKSPLHAEELFDRIEKLVEDIQGGLTYADAVKR
jgi:aspartate/methionine/tyrosine aminotransferase